MSNGMPSMTALLGMLALAGCHGTGPVKARA